MVFLDFHPNGGFDRIHSSELDFLDAGVGAAALAGKYFGTRNRLVQVGQFVF